MSEVFLGSITNEFTDIDVRSIHDQLHDSGIETQARVTFLLLETSLGLSFVSLVDDHTLHGTQAAELSMVTTGPSSANFWVNDFGRLDSKQCAHGRQAQREQFFPWH